MALAPYGTGIREREGDYIIKNLKEIRSRYLEILIDVRGKGFLIGMEFASNSLGYTLAKQLFGKKILVGGTINNATGSGLNRLPSSPMNRLITCWPASKKESRSSPRNQRFWAEGELGCR